MAPSERKSQRLTPLLLLALVAPVAAQEEARRLQQSFVPGDAGRVHLALSVGAIEVEATDGREVEVDLRLLCRRHDLETCRQRAQRLRLVPRMRRGILHLKVARTPRGRTGGIAAHYRVALPRHLGLEIDVRAGDVTLRGHAGDLEVDVAAGDVEASLPRGEVGSIHIDVGVGRAALHLDDGRVQGSGVLRSINWQGPGHARVNIDVGTGDADVRLE